jgi:hypothetical protein
MIISKPDGTTWNVVEGAAKLSAASEARRTAY